MTVKNKAGKDDKMPLVPKPADGFWALCNRYYKDGERVQFKVMRGSHYLEGEGVVVSAHKNEYGRVGYYVKPDDKGVLANGAADERRRGLVDADLEELAGGPWSRHGLDKGKRKRERKHETHGQHLPEKLIHFNITTDDHGRETLSRRYAGFKNDMEVFGWLRVIAREMEVTLISTWSRSPDFCSYCGRHRDEVEKLIAGRENARICDVCVGTCADILKDGQQAGAGSGDASG